MKTKENITLEEVMKVDIRMGKVIKAERVPKSKKLMELTVDFGKEVTKTSVTNLGEYLDEAFFLDSMFPFVVNMPPFPMMGITSEAMIMVGTMDDAEKTFDFDLSQKGTHLLQE